MSDTERKKGEIIFRLKRDIKKERQIERKKREKDSERYRVTEREGDTEKERDTEIQKEIKRYKNKIPRGSERHTDMQTGKA